MRIAITGAWNLPLGTGVDSAEGGLTDSEATMAAEICMQLEQKLRQMEEHVDFELAVEVNPFTSDSMLEISLTINPKGDETLRRTIVGKEFSRDWDVGQITDHFLLENVAAEFENRPGKGCPDVEIRMFVLIQALVFQKLLPSE